MEWIRAIPEMIEEAFVIEYVILGVLVFLSLVFISYLMRDLMEDFFREYDQKKKREQKQKEHEREALEKNEFRKKQLEREIGKRKR